MAQWNRIAHHEIVPGAGHGLPYSHAAEVVSFLRQMLREN
jgi:pimeloyl-ACP methyl ester carboxylesterase